MHIVYPAVVSALLFSVGVYGVLARRNTILVLMSVELMLNAVNLNLVAFDVWLGDRLHSGQVLTLFIIVIAAAEVGLGLAIVLALYRNRRTVDIDHLRDLSEPPAEDGEPLRRTAEPAAVGLPAATSTPGAGNGPRTDTEATSTEAVGSDVGSHAADPNAGDPEAAGPNGAAEPATGPVKRGGTL
ncbi:NADH-quinone oxidoreductase subunit NuoK [Nonomuraea rhizosphaerae]|uniref:NADH-quinone oxidoreductase subunit NuoK n=1 Tax=Nonomuraea rhizosphaerae TaxID=2665663 RepID=UPI0027E26094|nr:NADH-quinone oxidoreductase subunit NuoK [Nonomuraea rhizosphaerae]